MKPGRSVTSSGEADGVARPSSAAAASADGGVDVADRDAAALARERQRERLADPAAAAGDDGDLAVQRTRLLGHVNPS